nr:DUF1345 domain-containing protein [uncultured Sphingomonas sp.]
MAVLVDKLNRIAPWRFLLFFILVIGASGVASFRFDWSKGLLIGFDIAALTFLLTCLPLFRYDAADLRDAAEKNDANRPMLLAITFVLSLIIFAAVLFELNQRSQMALVEKGLIALTLGLVWTFGNMVYTLHYMHLFYMPDAQGREGCGLIFPATPTPLLSDFTYFSYTLGVALQTSDVVVADPNLRKIVTFHCVAGFFFNLGVFALTINILGGG